MKWKVLFYITGLFITVQGLSQDAVLMQRLKGTRNLDNVYNELKAHYADPATRQRLGTEQMSREIKHWRRWLWYMSSRVDEKANFVNIDEKLMEANHGQLSRPAANEGMDISTQSATGSWSLVGPVNTTSGIGRVDRLAFHPTDANTVYAGTTAGGLWRTTNAGSTWTNLTPNISSPAISGIAIDPNNPNNIYILTGDGDSNVGGLVDDYGYMRLSIGVLRSTDGGNNWQQTGIFPGANYNTLVGYRLRMHPNNPLILYACTSQGLFITLNGGNTWALSNGFGRFYDMVFQPGSINVCYAISSTGGTGARASFWRSTVSGFAGTWDSTLATNNLINNPTNRLEIAVTPANNNLVYLLCGGVPATGVFGGLLRSTNAGLTFTVQSTTPNIVGRSNVGADAAQQSNYDLAIAASNTQANTVITGGIRCWRSLNGGQTGGWDFRGSHHEDVHDLGFHPADNKLWMANDGGVYSSTDNGANWTSHFSGMSITQFYRMAVSPDNYLHIIAGAQDNGIKRRPAATGVFDHVSGMDGFTMGYDAANASTFYAIRNQSVIRFTNNGAANNDITPNAA
ncbi:MAG TPA: hypothetical protein VK907_10665, partial [Phnomibacter sp.]|nr:hypothetical protein [Phnomibacter sp.]